LIRDVARSEPQGGGGRVQPALSDLFIYLFFSGQGTGSATQRVPQHRPWELGGSLELSLRNAGGIWFKTLLSVGDANTATTEASEAGSVGVATELTRSGNTH